MPPLCLFYAVFEESKMTKIEVIATTMDDALKIQDCGGDRIELIMGFREDGLTPSMALIESVTKRVKIPVNVMIRPHAKSFVLNEFDVEIMKREIEIVKNTNANGIVIGGITNSFDVDEANMRYLLSDIGNLDVTFHACSNYFKDIKKNLDILSTLPVTSMLTKGGLSHIEENLSTLKNMVEYKKNFEILVGSNINHENVAKVIRSTGAKFIHVGTAVRQEKSQILGVDEKSLRKFVEIVKNIE